MFQVCFCYISNCHFISKVPALYLFFVPRVVWIQLGFCFEMKLPRFVLNDNKIKCFLSDTSDCLCLYVSEAEGYRLE